MRIKKHPILGSLEKKKEVNIVVDGKMLKAIEGEPIASALMANKIITFRKTRITKEPRGYFCGIGLCTDCMMIVNGVPNVRTCITPVTKGMKIETQTV
ncbi:MAG: (2Fe-2S)-binding protein [Candidatus Bathyarchaeota archaeon]|nr:MAG: (2Fe-2S)-binding protein [Candidatus Bathyarchaeota archaeon]